MSSLWFTFFVPKKIVGYYDCRLLRSICQSQRDQIKRRLLYINRSVPQRNLLSWPAYQPVNNIISSSERPIGVLPTLHEQIRDYALKIGQVSSIGSGFARVLYYSSNTGSGNPKKNESDNEPAKNDDKFSKMSREEFGVCNGKLETIWILSQLNTWILNCFCSHLLSSRKFSRRIQYVWTYK